jgi:predicted DNA binding CopG/RHH family protein
LGFEIEEEEKKMKKQFGKLSKAEQEKIESKYHQMKPEEFDELMSEAKQHTPDTVRLPSQLVEALKILAELEGEPRYQTLVRKWIEERLQQEAKLALKLSKMPLQEVVAVLKRHVEKKSPVQA